MLGHEHTHKVNQKQAEWARSALITGLRSVSAAASHFVDRWTRARALSSAVAYLDTAAYRDPSMLDTLDPIDLASEYEYFIRTGMRIENDVTSEMRDEQAS